MSLIELEAGDAGLPSLPLLACDLKVGDYIFLAGFPNGGALERDFPAKVRGNGADDLVEAQLLTAKGLSGGPYLTADGRVVAFHRGGIRYIAGWAQLVPIAVLRTSLEPFLPPIATDTHCPAPDNAEQKLIQRVFAYLGVPLDAPDPKVTFEQRVHQIEEIIAILRDDIAWNIVVEPRPGVGNVIVVDYKRTITGEPPAAQMVVRSIPIVSNAQQSGAPRFMFSQPHYAVVSGRSGRYEFFGLDSDLQVVAANEHAKIEAVRLELGYKPADLSKFEPIKNTTYTFQEPFNP